MSFYKVGESFRWFIARVVDIKDPEFLGRVKIRVINDQTGEVGRKRAQGDSMPKGISDEDLLWAWPLSAIQSASLSWIKINELENYKTPDWIDAVGLSPTGIAVSTYVFGFYLDGDEQNLPVIFGTYHKQSRYPEPPTDPSTGKMLQIEPPQQTTGFYSDVSSLAKGYFFDPEGKRVGLGQTLPKEPYSVSSLWKSGEKESAPVDEFPTAYSTEYPYNTTYTTKSGHAIELDDTPGHERIHIWHRSGCYEEVSNGPSPFIDGDTRSVDISKDWPRNGPAGYTYKTAGGVVENDYIGRRSRKTMDSCFESIGKDLNELIKRDHNVEIANTETVKVGNTVHWTIGWQQPPGNRKNDNGKTNYSGGGIDKYNLYLDVANNTIQTSQNNMVLSIGAGPEQEHRLTENDVGNLFMQVGNNHLTNIGNNQTIVVAGNQITKVDGQHRIIVGEDSNITVEGEYNLSASNGSKIQSDVTILGNVTVDGSLGTTKGASGSFTSADGKLVIVTQGIVTKII